MPLTEQREQELRVLEFIYTASTESGEDVPMGAVFEFVGNDDEALRCLSSLTHGMMVDVDGRLMVNYRVTSLGRDVIQKLHKDQNDRGKRRGKARDQMLRWVDSKATEFDEAIDRAGFDGAADLLPFTKDEAEEATDYLVGKGLLKSFASSWGAKHLLVSITQDGRDCIDDGKGIPAFLQKGIAASQIIHMGGTNNTYANAIGPHSTATANVSNFNPGIALQFAAAVRDAMPVLHLPPEAEDHLRDIEQRDDTTRAQRATAALYSLVAQTSTGALGSVLGALGLQALGIGS